MKLDGIKQWWATIPVIYPAFLAAAPVLFLVANNIGQVGPAKAVPPILLSVTFAMAAYIALRRLPKGAGQERHKAGALVGVAVVLFWTYGHALDAFAVRIPALVGPNQWWFFAAWLAVGTLVTFFVARLQRVPEEATRILNFVVGVFIAISLAQMAWGLAQQADATPADATSALATGAGVRPDIYHLLLDGYGGPRHLDAVYGFDNEPFLEGLEARGFQVARNATSNYAMTFLSLASTLNLDYLDDLDGRDGDDRSVPYHMMQDNALLRTLDAAGYETVHFSSGWGGTEHNPHADRNIRCGRFDDFAMTLLQTTLLRPLQEPLLGDDHRSRILCTFDRLPELADDPRPTYAFAHMVTPHNPYVFHADGSPRADNDLSFNWARWGERDPYLGQLAFVNNRLDEMIDRILADSPEPPIILIHADHGTAVRLAQDRDGKGAFEDRLPDEPTPEQVQERYDILFAVLTPPADPSDEGTLRGDVSVVNGVRWLLNETLGVDLSPLPDKAFYSVYEQPYHFRDVTDWVRPNAP